MIRSTIVPIICITLWLQILIPQKTFALGLRPAVLSGVMQQPASQYYHFMYGLTGEVRLYNSWVIRGSYIERPAFSNAGFVDQDFLGYIDTGAAFFKNKNFEILSYAGVGQAWGYIKEEASEDSSSPRRNDYSLKTLSFSMEASLNTGFIDTRLGHSMHIGQGDKAQTDAKVAWPYSTYYLSFSKMIGSEK